MDKIKYWEKDCLELDGILTFDSNNFMCIVKKHIFYDCLLVIEEYNSDLQMRFMLRKDLKLPVIRKVAERITFLDRKIFEDTHFFIKKLEKIIDECQREI